MYLYRTDLREHIEGVIGQGGSAVLYGSAHIVVLASRVGKVFQLIIVTADEQANKAFEDYVAAGRSAGWYTGVDSLPVGVKEYVRIAVTRQ